MWTKLASVNHLLAANHYLGPISRGLAWLRKARQDVTTLVSYSDPSVGHTGALYRACNWLWAPTWHRLRPPPSGNGAWSTGEQSGVKDRWVFPILPDPARAGVLKLKDDSILARHPWAEYREPGGVSFKQAVVAQLVEQRCTKPEAHVRSVPAAP